MNGPPHGVAHQPVMPEEVVRVLDPTPGQIIVDGTVGLGGHAALLLQRVLPHGRVIGVDQDPASLAMAAERLRSWGARFVPVHGNFRSLGALLRGHGITRVHGVLLDLGVSSWQFALAGRGFSFQREGPLDMRLDPSVGRPAADLVNRLREPELRGLLTAFGEEPCAGRIARAVCAARRQRPITTTTELAELVARVMPRWARRRIHPATRTFQALRIAVNDELAALEEGLTAALGLLTVGGRIAVVAFHSLEDRIVKVVFRAEARRGALELLTVKPLRPSLAEVEANPHARSARLRAAVRGGV